jgi:FkbM family methyltransferase
MMQQSALIQTLSRLSGYKYLKYELGFRQFCRANKAAIDQLFAHLGDEQSRQVLATAMKGRPLQKDSLYKNIYDNQFEMEVGGVRIDGSQYFAADIMSLHDHETFVDAGGFVGDTTLNFIDKVRGQFRKVHIFEIDDANMERLQQNVSNHPQQAQIDIHPVGLYKKTAQLQMGGADNASSVQKGAMSSHKTCQVVALDEYLPLHERAKITFVKMDIEGAEMDALMGMKETIQLFKPKLAICIYHSAKELITIPLLIKSLHPGYKLYIRHHSPIFHETVCYAV